MVSSPSYIFTPNLVYALVDSLGVDSLLLPQTHSGFVTVRKSKKGGKGGMCGLKDAICDQSVEFSRLVYVVSLDFFPSSSHEALRACAASSVGL